MDDEATHLRNKIEIIYNYNSSYVPEFAMIHTIDDPVKLNEIYELALKRVHQENYSQHKNMLDTILPLFEVVESRKGDPGTYTIAVFMLMSVQGTIKGHLETLTNLKRRNAVEEKCLNLCQQISSLTHKEAMQFFPLFKKYLVILIKHQDKITAPLSFEDPSKLVNGICKEGSPEMILQSCLII